MTTATFPTPSIWLAHRISYGETDAMGIVYYAEYLHIFERARDAYIRVAGESYSKVEEKGLYLPVREVQCRYRASARFDDVVMCRVAVGEWGRASVTFVYELMDESRAKTLVTGMTQHATVDTSGRPVRLPSWLREVMDGVVDGTTVTL